MEKRDKRRKKERAHGVLRSLAFMISLARKRRPGILFYCLALAAAAILLSVTRLWMLPAILGAVEESAPIGRLAGIILLFAALLMSLTALGAYLASASQFGRVELRLTMAGMIQNKTLTMSYPLVEDRDVQRKKDRAVMQINGNQCAAETIWATLTDLLKNTAEFLICLSLLTALHPALILAVLAAAVISFSVSNHLNGWGWRHRDEEAGYSRRMNYLSERSRDYTLAKDVRIFGLAAWIEDVYDSTLRMFRSHAARAERVYLWGNAVDALMTFLRGAAVYGFLIAAVLRGEMTAAQFVLISGAVSVFSDGIGGIMGGLSILRRQSLDVSAVREFLDTPEPFRMEDGTPVDPDPQGAFEIRFRDVSFRYPGAEQDTLSHIDLTIAPGEKLAVVGRNGAGKTTLIKLLCGFLDPTGGQVLINGTDVRTLNRREYYRLFSAVFQDTSVLAVSIAENIAQTDGPIDGERMDLCISRAGLEGKIRDLPRGLRTHLGRVFEDGIDLSGGEMQSLMLARALYKDAPILVLDEPTSALDPIAESEIYRKYHELTAGRTAVYISHRLASTRFCDRILLIEGGRIAEEGTHDALMAQKGRYAELFEIQSRYYQEGGEEYEGDGTADPARA